MEGLIGSMDNLLEGCEVEVKSNIGSSSKASFYTAARGLRLVCGLLYLHMRDSCDVEGVNFQGAEELALSIASTNDAESKRDVVRLRHQRLSLSNHPLHHLLTLSAGSHHVD